MEENKIVEDNIEKEKIKKTPKEKTIFGLKIAGNVLFYAIILFLLLFSIMNINAGSSNGGFPNIFGHGFLSVQSNSMTRSGTLPDEYNSYTVGEFAKGDLLYVDVIKNEKDVRKLKVGDVITFYDDDIENLNSHRIVFIEYDSEGIMRSLSVQGDLSASISGVFNPEDSSRITENYYLQQQGDVKTFTVENSGSIKGVVTGVSYGAGNTLDNIKNNWFWFFVLPVIIALLVELFFVIRNIVSLTGEKQKASLESDREKMISDMKEEMRAQILAELNAKEKEEENIEYQDDNESK